MRAPHMTFANPTTFDMAMQLFDPRGRAGRRDFLYAAITMFVLQVALLALVAAFDANAEGFYLLPANFAFVYMGYAAISRRMHDLGISAWWMPAAVGIWLAAGFMLALLLALILGPSALSPGKPGFWLAFFALLAAPLTVAVWLHVAPGDSGPNQFGPPSEGAEPGPAKRAPFAMLVPAE